MQENKQLHKNMLIIGDLHIDNRKTSIKNSENFDEVFRLFNLITRETLERKPEFVVFLGDIFDSPDNISTNVISIVSMLFDNLSKLARIIIVAGNHDSVDDTLQKIDLTEGKKEYLRSSLVYPLSLGSEIMVVDKPMTSDLMSMNLPVNISFVPYQIDIISAVESIQEDFRPGFYNIMFGHFETRDLNYVKIARGSGAAERLPSAEELFSKYGQNLVILGHVHEASEIRIGSNRLYYTGSARNINYSNREEVKGIYSLDLETYEMEFIPNDNTAIYKVFKDRDALDKFLEESSDEKLAKTKVKFVYTDSKDTLRYHPFKKKLRRLEFEKSMLASDTSSEGGANISLDLDELKMENLMLHDNLLRFILDFRGINPDAKEEYLAFFKKYIAEAPGGDKNDD